MDVDWGLGELRRFVEDAKPASIHRLISHKIVSYSMATDRALAGQSYVVEQIFDRTVPDWRTTVPTSEHDRWQQHREAAARSITKLERAAELEAGLGDDAPVLSASALHPWAWEGARSMWSSRHYRQGVIDALKKVQAEAQNKTGRFDLSETKLFQEIFGTTAPQQGKTRLRLAPDDGSPTYTSVQRGAMALAEGLFAGVRNPAAHTVAEIEVDEQHALEELAAVSVLARWVQRAEVVTAP